MRNYLNLDELNVLAGAIATIGDAKLRKRVSEEVGTTLERLNRRHFDKETWRFETSDRRLRRWYIPYEPSA